MNKVTKLALSAIEFEENYTSACDLTFQKFIVQQFLGDDRFDESLLIRMSKIKSYKVFGVQGVFEKLYKTKWFTDNPKAQQLFVTLAEHYHNYLYESLYSDVSHFEHLVKELL